MCSHATMSVGDLIKARGLKQVWLAKRLGLSPSRFGAIVRGLRPIPTDRIADFAALLRLPVETVLTALTSKESPDADHEGTIERHVTRDVPSSLPAD